MRNPRALRIFIAMFSVLVNIPFLYAIFMGVASAC